jgi:hypothetical protein
MLSTNARCGSFSQAVALLQAARPALRWKARDGRTRIPIQER